MSSPTPVKKPTPQSPRPSQGRKPWLWMTVVVVVLCIPALVVVVSSLLVDHPKEDDISWLEKIKRDKPQRKPSADIALSNRPANSAAPAAPAPSLFDEVHPKNEKAEQSSALEVFKDFRQAATWQEKLKWVRQPDRVKPLMQSFYETHHRTEPPAQEQLAAAFRRGEGTPFLHVAFVGGALRGPTWVSLLREPEGSYRLDWESFVGAGDLDWEDFKATRPSQPQLMRALLQQSTYCNYEFTDQARFFSVRLASADGETVVYGFCERNSDLGGKIKDLLRNLNGDSTRATVRLAFPEHAQSNQCVKLLELVAQQWLLPGNLQGLK